MVVVVDVDDEALIDQVVAESKNYLEEQSQAKEDEGTTERVRTWDKALEVGKDAPLALISIPGVYAAPEIERALDAGKHVFCFSDNVSIEDEARLKKLAHEKGLLLMGPDCGTGVANGIPLAFANRTRRGEIGIRRGLRDRDPRGGHDDSQARWWGYQRHRDRGPGLKGRR